MLHEANDVANVGTDLTVLGNIYTADSVAIRQNLVMDNGSGNGTKRKVGGNLLEAF